MALTKQDENTIIEDEATIRNALSRTLGIETRRVEITLIGGRKTPILISKDKDNITVVLENGANFKCKPSNDLDGQACAVTAIALGLLCSDESMVREIVDAIIRLIVKAVPSMNVA
jgi:hypothetical protein